MAAEMNSTPTVLSLGDSTNGQDANSESSMRRVIIFLITTLGGYLQVQYQSRKVSPFDEHKNIMIALYVTLLIYALGLIAEFKLGTWNFKFRIVRRFNPVIGFLVVVLLLIILLPLLGLVAFIIWTLFMVDAMIKPIQEILQWLCAKQFITTYFQRATNGSPRNQENCTLQSQESGSRNRGESDLSEDDNDLPA